MNQVTGHSANKSVFYTNLRSQDSNIQNSCFNASQVRIYCTPSGLPSYPPIHLLERFKGRGSI